MAELTTLEEKLAESRDGKKTASWSGRCRSRNGTSTTPKAAR
jgi:hypothetical protein